MVNWWCYRSVYHHFKGRSWGNHGKWLHHNRIFIRHTQTKVATCKHLLLLQIQESRCVCTLDLKRYSGLSTNCEYNETFKILTGNLMIWLHTFFDYECFTCLLVRFIIFLDDVFRGWVRLNYPGDKFRSGLSKELEENSMIISHSWFFGKNIQ